MNEKMLELYRQAWVPHMEIDPSNNMPYESTRFSAEKFAELIVRECTNMLPTDSIRNEEGVHMFYVIRDHFGVSPYEGVR